MERNAPGEGRGIGLGEGAIANSGKLFPKGKAAIADFLAETFPSLPLAKAGSQRGARCRKVQKILPKTVPKWFKNGVLEAPGSFLGSILKKTQVPARKTMTFWGPFWDPLFDTL